MSAIQLEMVKEKDLVKNDREVDGTEGDDDSLDNSISAVHAQEDRAE